MSLTTTTPLTNRIYQALLDHRVDCFPLHGLARVLGVTPAELRRAADSAPGLGTCPGAEPVVYCLSPQPLAAGFAVEHRGGRLRLRLAGRGLRPSLLVGGQLVGRVPRNERPLTFGSGELAYAISRLTLMALGWMPPVPDPTRYLFELVAEAWRSGSPVRRGGFGVHRTGFAQLVAREPETNRIELVTNRARGGHWLVNLYPTPARGVAR